MTGSSTSRSLMILALCWVVSWGCKRQQQNLVIITLDTCRADRMGAYGYVPARTPCFDRLAGEGVLFHQCSTPSPVTLPAHCSLFTGLYPWEHGVRDNGAFRLPRSIPTLATIMQDAGYQTAAFVSAFTLDEIFGLGHGFQVYDDRYATGEKPGIYPERRAEDTTHAALAWLAGIGNQPYFLWVHYFDPHAPYSPPPSHALLFPDSPYDGEISYMDEQMERLLNNLPRPQDTILLVVGDHGESLGDHGEETHGVFVYESCLRVPCVLWMPKSRIRPRIVYEPISLVELMDCCLEIMRLSRISSRILRLARGENVSPLPVFFESVHGQLQYGWAAISGVRDGALKYIDAPRPELYDLSADPGELNNLHGKHPETSRLASLVASQGIQDGKWYDQALSESSSAALRQLGYLNGGTGERRYIGTGKDPKDYIHIASQTNQALMLSSHGMVKDAIDILDTLAAEHPDNKRVAFLAARFHWDSNNREKAESLARMALEKDPAYGQAWVLLGRILREADRLEEAAAAFGMATLDPETTLGAYNNQALCYEALGRLDEASRSFKNALACETRPRPELLMSYGLFLGRTGRSKEALLLLEEALALKPQHPRLLAAYGAILGLDGQHDKAIQVLERSLSTDPHRLDAWTNLAQSWMEMGHKDMAVAALDRAELQCGYHPEIQEMKSYIGKRQENMESKKTPESARMTP